MFNQQISRSMVNLLKADETGREPDPKRMARLRWCYTESQFCIPREGGTPIKRFYWRRIGSSVLVPVHEFILVSWDDCIYSPVMSSLWNYIWARKKGQVTCPMALYFVGCAPPDYIDASWFYVSMLLLKKGQMYASKLGACSWTGHSACRGAL